MISLLRKRPRYSDFLFKKRSSQQINIPEKGDSRMNNRLLQEYMITLINLADLHKKAFGDRDIVIPTCFSETICRSLLSLDKLSSKNVDAVDSSGATYEIKATSTKSGTTTIRKDQNATYLIWVYFDFVSQKIIIRKTNYKSVKVLVEKDRTSNNRANIRLSKISTWETVLSCEMNNLWS